ncbi:MAG TPA: hypothetical protein VKO42_02280, partial [Patescibacteria group bacterium]|nr:hypothetical protein [Patescibacteria group bacterium]
MFSMIHTYFEHRRLLHIAGSYKTGKSLLIKDIVKYYAHKAEDPVPNTDIDAPCFYLLDTERKFPKSVYSYHLSEKFMKHRVFVSQSADSISFLKTIRYLAGKKSPLQRGDFVIVDSVSEFIKQNI